jgi:DNA-binding PadR family transcriptional regulator
MVSLTRLMVLGLLTYKPMSGYELQQALIVSQADKWAGILPGSIYHALKKLDQEGLVELEGVQQTGNRSKATYRITPKGQEELSKLTVEALSERSVVFPTSIYTALSFLHLVPRDVILTALQEQIVRLEEDYRDMKKGEEEKTEAIPLTPEALLVFENIYGQYELQLQFLRKLAALYAEQEGN